MTSRAAARRRRQREVAARWDQLQGQPQIEETLETDSNGFLHVGAEDKGILKSEKIAIANDKGHRTELQVEKTILGAAANTNDKGHRNELQVEKAIMGAAANANDKGTRNEPQGEKTVLGAAANANDKGHRNEPQVEKAIIGAAANANDKDTRNEPQVEKTKKKKNKKKNKKVQAPRDDDFDAVPAEMQSMSAEDRELLEKMIEEAQRSADEDIKVKILRARGFDVLD